MAQGETLIEQGEHGDHFFVVESGAYDVFLAAVGRGQHSVKTYKSGDAFGESCTQAGSRMPCCSARTPCAVRAQHSHPLARPRHTGELALMYNTPRAATVRCSEAGSLWQLSRSHYRATLIADSAATDQTTNDFLRRVPLFEGLTSDQISRISSASEIVKFETPQIVVSQGEIAEHIYVITKGSAYAQKRGTQDKFVMKPKMCFGESALSTNAGDEGRVRKADVFAEAGCSMLKLAVSTKLGVGLSLDEGACAHVLPLTRELPLTALPAPSPCLARSTTFMI